MSTLLLTSCGSQVREGEASSYLVIQSLEGSSGAEPGEFGNPVFSDVQTFVNDEDIPCCPTFFNDLGQAVFRLVMKDPGTAGSPTTPTPNNWITLTQYRVTFFRTDGRNTPGVDVPHGFDGAITATVREETTVSFDLVRNAAKLDAPLRALRFGGGANLIHAIAEITFFGHDQTGREVSVTGRINIHFGDFGDPE
ncbi:MAG: hypothetical protein ACRD09_16595 [Vicinamibacterales bacterium]